MPSVVLEHNDCFEAFRQVPDCSIDAVITDPPYFLDKLKSDWELEAIANVTRSSQVTSLPGGMKFDPQQGLDFQRFMGDVAEQALRVLKPGGFFLSFSAPRLVHRLGVAVEDVGFHVRDMWLWLYTQNQVKAMSVARFLPTLGELDDERKAQLEQQLAIWKTPQIKSCVEPIVCAQRPPEGTFLHNWAKYGVGLINSAARVGEDATMFPANVLTTESICGPLDRAFLVPKPGKTERGDFNKHISVKPLALMSQLISLTVRPGGRVLDPFSGSGSTGIAAVMNGCNYLGFELNPDYFTMSQTRFDQILGQEGDWRADGNRVEATFDAPGQSSASA